MRRIIAALAILLLVSQAGAYDLTLPVGTPAEVYYSPRGGAQAALVRHIDAARESIYVLAYSFTSRQIAEALERAARRGVHKRVALEVRLAPAGLAHCRVHRAHDAFVAGP